MPANPGLRLRLTMTTERASSTLRIGMPAMGIEGSESRANGLTTSLAPTTSTTSVCRKVGLIWSISFNFS